MKYFLLSVSVLLSNFLFAQHKEQAEAAVARGIPYHDKGDYEGAIKRYDSALKMDNDNLLALAEKAYSLLSSDKYDESIECCKKAIKKHPNEEGLKMLYVTYGTDYDYEKKTDKSIEVYEEGLKLFPDFYLLQFNKGISLFSVKRYDESEVCYQRALMLNPNHAGSNNAIGRLNYIEDRRVPAIFGLCRLLVLEPQSERAKNDLDYLQKTMNTGVEKNAKGDINIYVKPSDSTKKENNFSTIEMMLSMTAALSLDTLKLSPTANFAYRFGTFCSTLKESKDKNYGFYWDYYAPYFIEMKDKNFVETFSHIIFASTDDKENDDWLKNNKQAITDFYDWSKGFTWKQK